MGRRLSNDAGEEVEYLAEGEEDRWEHLDRVDRADVEVDEALSDVESDEVYGDAVGGYDDLPTVDEVAAELEGDARHAALEAGLVSVLDALGDVVSRLDKIDANLAELSLALARLGAGPHRGLTGSP